jgi:hypothetical protein
MNHLGDSNAPIGAKYFCPHASKLRVRQFAKLLSHSALCANDLSMLPAQPLQLPQRLSRLLAPHRVVIAAQARACHGGIVLPVVDELVEAGGGDHGKYSTIQVGCSVTTLFELPSRTRK